MKRLIFHLAGILILCGLVLSGCSGNKNPDQVKKDKKPSTERAVDAIKELGSKPMEKARATQQLGEERTKAIDDAVESQ